MKRAIIPMALIAIATSATVSLAETQGENSAAKCHVKKSCENSSTSPYVAYGGFLGGAGYINVEPIRAVLVSETALNGIKSPIFGKGLESALGDREVMGVSGGFGMAGKRDGILIGGGGINGSRRFSTVQGDSSYTVDVQLSYGGVMVGNVATKGKNSFGITGLVGAGVLGMDIYSSSVSGLNDSHSKEWDFDEDLAILSGKSYFFVTDLTANYTYSFKRWVHAGVDLGGSMNYSMRGFNGTDGYTSFNPMIRGRVSFGVL